MQSAKGGVWSRVKCFSRFLSGKIMKLGADTSGVIACRTGGQGVDFVDR